MNGLQVFTNQVFGKIRTIEENGKVLFCGSDVARALGYSRPNDAISAHCRATVKRRTPISGKLQEINFISEGDVYRLITHSKLPAAQQFESWVFDEVLPTIHRKGEYAVQPKQTPHCTYNNRPVATLRQIADHAGISVQTAQNRFAWHRKEFTYGTEYEILYGCTMEQFKAQNPGYGCISKLTVFTPEGARRMLEICKRCKTTKVPAAKIENQDCSIDETVRNIRCFLDTAQNLNIFMEHAKSIEDKKAIAQALRFNFAVLMVETESLYQTRGK